MSLSEKLGVPLRPGQERWLLDQFYYSNPETRFDRFADAVEFTSEDGRTLFSVTAHVTVPGVEEIQLRCLNKEDFLPIFATAKHETIEAMLDETRARLIEYGKVP